MNPPTNLDIVGSQQPNPQATLETIVSRRTMLKAGGAAGIGMIALGTTACGENLSFWVETIVGSLEELKPLLPSAASLITTAVSVAKQFNDAWKDGKFVDAGAIFKNLSGVVGQIFDAAGLSSPAIKTIVAVVGIALRTIGVLMAAQAQDPLVAAEVNRRRSTATDEQISLIQKMADPRAVEALFQAARP